MFVKREFPTVLEECFQTPIEGAIYAEIIDRLRAAGAHPASGCGYFGIGAHGLGSRESRLTPSHGIFSSLAPRFASSIATATWT